ncbi:heterokaryon incompatibility protein-domain-containing protein [Xylogone sp. PMI_703]|nr:heterokaryon incompatibility protein-domain-containing protein [Xylogone sp. PMI_703]
MARSERKLRASGTFHSTLSDLQSAARNYCGVCHVLAQRLSRYSGDVAAKYLQDPLRFKFRGDDEWNRPDDAVDFIGLGEAPFASLSFELLYGVALRNESCVAEFLDPWAESTRPIPIDEEIRNLIPTARNTGDPAVLQLTHRWLKNCQFNHSYCSQTHNHEYEKFGHQDGWFPDRLLDLTGDSPRLLVTTEEQPVHSEYATLSHCWGPNPKHLTLTSDNIESFRVEIPLNTLQKTFRDAIQTAKSLGIYYLWIDSLCIIQSGKDSRKDWETQAAAMNKIYSNCTINIAADHAANANEGCFVDRDIDLLNSVYFKREGEAYVLRENDIDMQVLSLPLAQRGWVMQERLLSPRVLHFGPTQIYWECQEMAFASEIFPGGLDLTPNAPFNIEIPLIGGAPGAVEWSEIVSQYSKCALTFPAKDKFMALSAIAERYSALYEDRYVAGFFKSRLPEALLWRVGGTADRPASVWRGDYRAPTWSWMNIDGPVDVSEVQGGGPFEDPYADYFKARKRKPQDDSEWKFARVQDFQIELISPDSNYGPVKYASITLEGRLFSDEFLKELHKIWLSRDKDPIKEDEDTRITMDIVMDSPLPSKVDEMPLMFPFGCNLYIHGLFLEKRGEGSLQTYSRLGYFCIRIGRLNPYSTKDILGEEKTVVLV